MLTALNTIFASVGLLYGLLVPLLVAVLLAFFFVPSLMLGGARAPGVGRALYCYLQQSFGVLLMTLSGLPSVESVLSGRPYDTNTYVALLIIFTVGGLIFLWHDVLARAVPSASRAVPFALFFYTFKCIGSVVGTLAFLSLIFTLLLRPTPLPADFWVGPTILLLYGILLTWCTWTDPEDPSPFRITALAAPKHAPLPAPLRKALMRAKVGPVGLPVMNMKKKKRKL